MDGGEHRSGVLAGFDIVNAYDRQLFGNPASQLSGRLHGADGSQVVGAEQGGNIAAGRQKPGGGPVAAFRGKRGIDNMIPVQGQGELGQRIPIAPVTDFVFSFSQIGNVDMPQFCQITHCRFGGQISVAGDLVEFRIDIV